MHCLFRVKTVTLETANVTNCHVIATDILFLSSNHRSVQFLYLAASQLSQSAILFIGRAPRPQALTLMKIAPAARTYGLHLCSEVFFIFFRLFYLGVSMGLTDRRKTAKHLADSRKNLKNLTVSRKNYKDLTVSRK